MTSSFLIMCMYQLLTHDEDSPYTLTFVERYEAISWESLLEIASGPCGPLAMTACLVIASPGRGIYHDRGVAI